MSAVIDLDALTLETGQHDDRDGGVCLLEAAAWYAGEPHSDSPECVSPVLAAFGRAWDDALEDGRRQELVRYIPRLVGTAGDPAADLRRAWMALDWLVRVHAPAWLRLAGLEGHADALAGLPALDGEAALADAGDPLDAAGAAARDALAPTRDRLIASAHDLYDRMIDAEVQA